MAQPGRTFRNVDLIVLGAGPAGSAAAATAAESGLSVALVDMARFPRDKLCGGALTGRAMTEIRRAFGFDDVPVAHSTRTTIAFHAYGEPLGTTRDAPALRLTMRRDLDAALADRARTAGAITVFGQRPDVDLGAQRVRTDTADLTSPLILAADGVNSAIARQLFGSAFDRRRIGFALEIEDTHPAALQPLRIDFGAAQWGYGWQFPKPCGQTIGVGGVLSRNANLKGALADYLSALGVTADKTEVKGQFLPFGAFRDVPGRGRILLAGDAAGLVDPITGEGIGHAVASGRLAAEAAQEALSAGRPDRALDLYRSKLAPIHTALRHARRLRPLFYHPRFRHVFINGFRTSTTLRRDYLALLAGDRDYADLMRAAARRLPIFAARLLRSGQMRRLF